MATEFILAPNARWQGRDETGQPIQGGKLYTYLNNTVTPKATYKDPNGAQPNTNPVILDGKGEANIYWATDDLYTIKLFTADDQEVYTQNSYPVVGTNTTMVVSESESNIVRNAQFNYWYYGTSFPVSGTGSADSSDYICDDWYYTREDSAFTLNITRETFALDQDEVPGNPVYFFRYQANSAPMTENNNRLWQTYQSVQTLAGQTVTFSMQAKSPTASTVNVYLVQKFGSGGSADNPKLVGQFDLTTSWNIQHGTVTLDTLAGKTLGNDGTDALILMIKFPNDVAATVDVVNIQLQTGAVPSNFPLQTLEAQFQELVNRVDNAVPSTGDVKATFQATAPDGWLLCNDTTIGNYTSNAGTVGFKTKALYKLLWTNVDNKYAPVYTSAGVLTTRGATAEEDFNAFKTILLTRTIGRAIASAGTGSVSQTVTAVDTGADTLTVAIGDGLIYNSTPVVFSTTGTLPSPLVAATTYYARNASSTTFQVFSTAANAINNSGAIDLTTSGSGVITVAVNYSAYTLGQPVGELNHGLIIAEMPNHNHPGSTQLVGLTRDGASNPINFPAGSGSPMSNITVASQGGSGIHNITQPTVFMNYMIRL